MEKIDVLPLKEARLLRFFIENTGKCLTRSEIQRAVWDGVKIESRTIDSHISRLRKRISLGEVTIESLYGDGYKMN
jgi:DNA-binding response OmpR family regulator